MLQAVNTPLTECKYLLFDASGLLFNIEYKMSTEFQRTLTWTAVIILSDNSTGCDEMRRAIILQHKQI